MKMLSNKLAAAYSISRIGIAFIWLYHGLVPKLIFRHATELELVGKGPVIHSPETMVLIAGVGEVILGCLVLFFWRRKWPAHVSVAGFALLLVGALVLSPSHATHAFNPVTLTVCRRRMFVNETGRRQATAMELEVLLSQLRSRHDLHLSLIHI